VVDALVRDRTARPRTIAFLNAHVLLLAQEGPEGLGAELRHAGVVAVDGISIALASWVLNGEWLPRCVMTWAFDAYTTSRRVTDARAILAGATGPEAEAAAAAINRQSPHLRVVKSLSGHLPLEAYANAFATSEAIDLVLLGMGSPRTETVMRCATERCPTAVAWHIGAGTVKYYAGTKQRTPRAIQACGLQWLHRLVFEPHTRKRYLLGLPRFAWWLAKARFEQESSADTAPELGRHS
jgi:N-acetylglucosaminyldiphosphoundecaprenol N-acetyl-beta-D-mannosaminyltransferase